MVRTASGTSDFTRERRVSAVRLFAGGCALAAIAVLIGFGVEFRRLGASDEAAAARLEQDVRAHFIEMTGEVQGAAQQIAGDPTVAARMKPATEPDDGARVLFDLASRARQQRAADPSLLAVTIYDATGDPRAWAGRASDLARERTKSAASLFVAPSPLGLRLVYLQPIAAPAPDGARVGAVAAERVLADAPAASMLVTASAYSMLTPRGRVTLTLHGQGPPAAPGESRDFTITAPDGTPILDASIQFSDLAADRLTERRTVAAIAVAIFALTVLLLAGPLLDRRDAARTAAGELRFTLATLVTLLTGCALLWLAFVISPWFGLAVNRTAGRLLLSGLTAAAVGATLVPAALHLRIALRTARRWPDRDAASFAAVQIVCGVLLAALFVMFERVLGRSVDPAAVDLRHFSLHPWAPARLATLAGILLGHAALLWIGALACVTAIARWRLPRSWSARHVVVGMLWLAPTIVVAVLAVQRDWNVPALAIGLGALACACAALLAPRLMIRFRRATVAARMLTLFVAFLVPGLLVYPSVQFFGDRATRHVIETRYAVEAMQYPQTLQERMHEAQDEIDAIPNLADLIAGITPGAPRADIAFRIWSQTVLARERLTSQIEIYDRAGSLLSPFGLNFPEYAAAQTQEGAHGCKWEMYGEAQPFGAAQERNMLHAQRSICVDGRPIASIVVRVVFDYRTLSFIRSQSPYFDVFSTQSSRNPIESSPVGDVDVAIYGWGLTAFYTSGSDAWPLDDDTFRRIYKGGRAPFWMVLRKNDTSYHVYFANDRQFIYAIGYPVPGIFDHLVRLAELSTLAAVVYVLFLLGDMAFSRLTRARPRTGRALLREIRASFYRKLFIAFVLASIVPVLTLSLVIRTYFAGILNGDIRDEALRTAAVAVRVIEELEGSLRQGSASATTPFSDDVMVWIGQMINQDVNVFTGPELYATSERDLFASGLLPTRTPDEVYRAIVLDHMPSVVTEDQIGSVPYTLAATPVRAAGRSAVLTVPLTLRQHEVEREIDELDRGVHLAALCFILIGAAIGLSMAERIADPISQLTRATRRLARGDFDARAAARSSDELRRLVDAFNGMAAELKAQRDQLERTHRLEAWAEMARQVAHEIKNPLTPIQLSAEHLRRVHADRGEPMGQVLESCVTTILGQVHLLRQIASEFSSFASSPTARRAPADPVRLIHDVVEPYRVGLGDRIAIVNDVQPPLPNVLIDRRLAARALANIVENALHAMPGEAGRLALSSRVEDGAVVIRIEDTGVGMDEEALARVFEPYFSTKTTGTGLGLPIARRNIELSGGSVAVESQKDRGTIVTIRLPVVPAAEA